MKKMTFLVFCLLATLTLVAQPRKWRVNNNSTYNQSELGTTVFNDLQQAVAAVAEGDTLYVESSVNDYGLLTINKKIHLIGTGYFLDQNAGLQHHQPTAKIRRVNFTAGSSGSTLEGLDITAQATTQGINFANAPLANISVTRCRVAGSIYFGNNAANTISNIVIKKSYVYGFGGLSGLVSGLVITNNIIQYCALTENHAATLSQNILMNDVNIYGQPFFNNIVLGSSISQNNNNNSNIHHNIFDFISPWLTGGSNFFGVNQANIFLNANASDDKKYELKSDCTQCFQGSPATVQMGIFGGADPYVLSGIPPIPSIFQILAPNSAGQGTNFNVTLGSRANN